MLRFLQRLFRDVVQGGSLVERLGKDLAWPTVSTKDLLLVRKLVVGNDRQNAKFETDAFMAHATQKIPIINTLFQSAPIFSHKGSCCQAYLFGLTFALDVKSSDRLELVLSYPCRFENEFQFQLFGRQSISEQSEAKQKEEPTNFELQGSAQYRNQMRQKILALDTLREALQALQRYPHPLFVINARGLQVQFDESLNREQCKKLVLTALEIGEGIASAHSCGRLSH